MAIALVQKATGGSSAALTVTATLPGAVTTGSLLVATHHGLQGSTPADPTWVKLRQVDSTGSATLVMYGKVALAGQSSTIVFNNVAAANASLSVLEYSGLDISGGIAGMIDRSIAEQGYVHGASGNNPGSSLVDNQWTNETGMTRRNEELAVAVVGIHGSNGAWNNTWTNGFTMQTQKTAGSGGSSTLSLQSVADKVLSSKGRQSTNESWTSGRQAMGLVATFRGATLDPPVLPPSATFQLKYEAATGLKVAPQEFQYWNGSAWVTKPSKVWTGTAWATRATSPTPGFALWSAQGYTSASDVVLAQDTLVDVAFPTAHTVTVPTGYTLAFQSNLSIKLQSTGNVIIGGKLQMDPVDATVTHELNFPAVNEASFVGGGNVPLSTDVGLWFTNPGVWEARGAAKNPWTTLVGSAAAGASSISVIDATGWRTGDAIVVVPMEPASVASHWLHYDERTISSISGTGPYTVGLSSPLTYPHQSVTIENVLHTGEVLNLSRNVKITGTAGGRTHVAFFSGGHTLQYVEADFTGPRNVTDAGGHIQNARGRYSFHFHEGAGKTYDGVLLGCVSHHSGGHAFVGHASNGITFQQCIAHDTFDEPFWYDVIDPTVTVPNVPGDIEPPVDVFFDRCVASKVQAVGSPQYRLSGFNLANGDGHRCHDCVAVGVQGLVDASGFEWMEEGVSVWDFDRNTAHNCARHGIFVWQNSALKHVVSNTVLFWNAADGIHHGAYVNDYMYSPGIICYGNGQAGLELSAQNNPGIYGPMCWDGAVFDGAGISPYCFIAGDHSLSGVGNVQMEDCVLKNYTTKAIGILRSTTQNDQVAFIDCTFSGAEVTWLQMASTCHINSVIYIINGNVNGHTYECRRSDFVGAGFAFYAPWNCMRKVT